MDHRRYPAPPYFDPPANQFGSHFTAYPPPPHFPPPPPPPVYQPPPVYMTYDNASMTRPQLSASSGHSTAAAHHYYHTPVTPFSEEQNWNRTTPQFAPPFHPNPPHPFMESKEFSQNITEHSSVENSGKLLVENLLNEWLFSYNSKPKSLPKINETKAHTESEVKKELLTLQHDLLELHQLASDISSVNEDSWLSKKSTILAVQEKIIVREKYISDELLASIMKRKKRNQRKKANRTARKQFQEETKNIFLEKCREQDKVTHKWLQERRQLETDEKNQRKKCRRAKLVLADVRRRNSEVKQVLEVIRGLSQLKNLRRSQAEHQKGFLIPTIFDEEFDQEVESLTRLLTSQQNLLIEEENNLRQKLEVADESKKGKPISDQLEALLFGFPLKANHGLLSVTDERYSRFYGQAQDDVHSFYRIRSEWDQYCSSQPNQGSHIPVGWVLPSTQDSD